MSTALPSPLMRPRLTLSDQLRTLEVFRVWRAGVHILVDLSFRYETRLDYARCQLLDLVDLVTQSDHLPVLVWSARDIPTELSHLPWTYRGDCVDLATCEVP